jgi:hydrogenase maturation factor
VWNATGKYTVVVSVLSMKTGKLEWKFMETLLSLLPVEDIDLVTGPYIGEDAAVIRLRDGFLVVHSDPITTGVKRAGYLAVHVAANDIAVRGVKPRWFLPVVLIPPTYSASDIKEIFSDMAYALKEIDGIAVGGHTEVTPGLSRPVISMTAAGYTASRVILTKNASEGDLVYVVGRVAGEGAGIIAWDFENELLSKGVSRSLVERAKKYIYDISVVQVALAVKDFVNSMHDATEGGVLQALREVAVASGKAIEINENSVLEMLEHEVTVITSAMNVDPLRLLSSGCIVATVPPHSKKDFESTLDAIKKPYRNVGVVRKGKGEVVLHTKHGKIIVNEDIIDEIYKLW